MAVARNSQWSEVDPVIKLQYIHVLYHLFDLFLGDTQSNPPPPPLHREGDEIFQKWLKWGDEKCLLEMAASQEWEVGLVNF